MSDPVLGPWEGPPAEWDELVEAADGGTLFHRLAYLDYHGDRFSANGHHLAWRKGDALHAVMPLGIFLEANLRVARSPFGASYGGVVTRTAPSLARAEQIVNSLIAHLRNEGVRRLVVQPPPALNWEQPHDYLGFWLLKRGARRVRSELTSYIPLTADPLEGFRPAGAKGVRKAQKSGVTVEESRDAGTFHEILTANRARFGVTPTHSREELEWLLEKLPQHVKLFAAMRGGEMIAGSLVFRVNRRVLLDFYWADRDEQREHRPVNLLVHDIARWAHAQGYRVFDFGTQTIDMEPRTGGTRFKESFGGLGVFRETYDLDL